MAEKMPPEIQQTAQQLDELQERYIATVNQRALIESELAEIERIIKSLEKLEKNSKVYRSVGNILFEEDREKLLEELKEKKEMDEILLDKYKKEEERLKTQITALQEKLKKMVGEYYQRLSKTSLSSKQAS